MVLIAIFILSFNLTKDWYVIETTHFNVYYYSEVSDFALRAVNFLEIEVYPKVTQILDMPLDRKVSVVIADIDDVGNGFALEIFDQIFVATADIYFISLRGRYPWLEDVLTHEFTHIVALRKVRKTPYSVPAFGISAGIFCILEPLCKISGNLRGKSTLMGGIISAYIPYSEPAYFTEGIAQLVTAELGYDSLDSYRNMMIRSLFYHNKLYPLKELGNFYSKTAWEGEIVYNHGFSFLTFIKEKYGWEAIRKAIVHASGMLTFSYESSFEYATGKTLEDLEKEWKEWLLQKYSEQIKKYEEGRENGMVGRVVPLERQTVGLYKPNIYWVSQPRLFKDGFLVIQDGTLMYYPSLSTSSPQKLGGVQSYSVSGTYIAFSYRKSMKKFLLGGQIPQEYLQLAVGYLVEEEKDRKHLLAIKDKKDIVLRASFPAFSPDLSKIVYVKTELDSRNIFIYDMKENKEERLTDFKGGKQFMFPSFSMDGKYVVAAYFDGVKQDIVLIDSQKRNIDSESDLTFITYDIAEDRDPMFISESQILFSSDSDGVFNLYIYDLETGGLFKITEELSGALFPHFSNGKILYVSFEPEGFRVKELTIADLQPEGENADYKNGKIPNILTSVQLASYQKTNSVQDERGYYFKVSSPRRARALELTSPIFFPEVGVPLIPLLTQSSSNFFLPLDLIGVTVEGVTFDRLGRLELGGRGFIGLQGSAYIQTNISSFHFENFIPILNLGASRYRVIPIIETTEFSVSQAWMIYSLFGAGGVVIPVIYGSPDRSLNLFIGGGGEIYSVSVKIGGFTFIPFSQSLLAKSARILPAGYGIMSFKAPIGTVSIGALIGGTLFYTAIDESIEQFRESLKVTQDRYSAPQVFGKVMLSYTLPVGYDKSAGLATYINGGYTFRDVDTFDEFRDAYLGYLQVFFGEIFLEGGASLLLDLWSGYLPLFRTTALHKVSLFSLFNSFRFAQREEKFWRGLCDQDGFWCSLSLGTQFFASVFYRYNLSIYVVGSRGFQDPLKAPFRLYLGIGIGF